MTVWAGKAILFRVRRTALLLRGNQWVRVIATAGCVLAGVVGVASCGAGRQLPPVVIGGVTAPTGGTEPLTRALVSSDGLHVTVPVSSSNMGCWDLALTADDKGSRVLLDASASPGTGIGAGCAHDAATTENLTATLRTPLWGRALADGATGQPVPYFDGRQLYSVGSPPTGYRLQQNTPWLDPWVIAQPKSPRGYTAWVREYVPPGACPMDSVNVQVSQFKPASVAAGLGTGRVRLRTRVDGHPAEVRAGTVNGLGSRESVTWTAGGYGFAVAWSGTASAPCPHPQPLSYASLLRVAGSLHR